MISTHNLIVIKQNKNVTYYVTKQSNNFGDQILELYKHKTNLVGFDTRIKLSGIQNCEGNWESFDKKTLRELFKEYL